MRNFSGPEEFAALKKTVTDAYQNLFPVKDSKGNSLELKKLWADDSDLDLHDYAAQKKARLSKNTWGAPVYASLVLRGPDGKVVDEMEKIRLSTIPRLTPRGSYIVGGNEYQVSNQLRRKPGAYVLKTQRGDEYKGVFSLGGEGSKNFEIHFDPEHSRYTVEKIAGSQGKLPLYPLLHALGASDQQIEKAWGTEVFAANKRSSDGDFLKYSRSLSGIHAATKPAAIEVIKTWAKSVKLDPHTTEFTLGKPHTSLTPESVLITSKRVLGAYKGDETPDDPENLLFKEVLSLEDMLHDKLNSKKHVQAMHYVLGRQLGRKSKIKDMINFQKLSSPVESFFTQDNRTSMPEQYNPAQMVSNRYKLTQMGTGGISDPHTVTPEIREVHPSHLSFVDPVHSPEGTNIGTMLHLASGTMKEGREVKTPILNIRSGKLEHLSPRELYSRVVAFPDEVTYSGAKPVFKSKEVRVQHNGKPTIVKPSDVEYVIPTTSQLFSYSTNLIPFVHNDQGTRAMMGAKMLEQAIPLIAREAPLVQTDSGDGKTSFHALIGEQTVVRAHRSGVVTAVHPDYIELDKRERIPLYNNFPLNQKTLIHHESVVKVGDKVTKGQLLSDSNFTRNGVLALGKNLKVAYLPYPGLTFEDGIAITESAAKKLATTQMYKHHFDLDPGKKELSLKRFASYYPNAIPHKSLGQYDADGTIKKGTIVQPGQVIIAGMHSAVSSPENATLKRINKALSLPWGNSSVKYTGEFTGEVTDVIKRAAGVDVYIKAVEPARASDKLSGAHGNKGVITKVIADSEAPHTADGSIPDVFLNPHGIISRINPGQLFESAASKIALKTGKTYLVKNFSGADSSKKVTAELKSHGIDDMEEMFLPDGKSIGKVSVGNPYILRLAKTGKSGFSARMPGSGYTLDMQPTRGGEEGTKSLDPMTFYSMLSHGAKKSLVDTHQKSEKNDEFWHAVETGKPLPAPKTSFVWNKFMSLLQGAGIKPTKEGAHITLGPMTDADVLKLSRGKITEPDFLFGKDLKEMKGGFFDKGITGGLFGEKHSHIELHEALPNPVFERAIKHVANLKPGELEGLIAGTKHVHPDGKISAEPGPKSVTSGAAIHKLLSQIDVPAEIAKASAQMKGATGAALNAINQRRRYLSALHDLKMPPEDAYIRKNVLVIPPVHRPIYEQANRGLVVAPANDLYRNVGILNQSHNLPVMKLLGTEDKQELRADLYKSTRQLAGLEPLETKGKAVPMEGFISQITHRSPKAGFFLDKIITKRQDLVGRGVVVNAPNLSVDELGIPEKMAWNIFRPFIVREYTMSGIGADVARKEIDDKLPRAKAMLQSAMKQRTVMMNRAPSLHKFNILAFKPVLVPGLAIHVPPLVMKGFNMDVDGDAVSLHVPVSGEAVLESHKMFPSRNLFKPGTGELMIVPSQESAIGLYFLSETAEGRKKINALLPAAHQVTKALDKKAARELYNSLAHSEGKDYANLVTKMKLLGDRTAYEQGFSTGLKDITIDRTHRDKVFGAADQEANRLRKTMRPGVELDHKIVENYKKATDVAYDHAEAGIKGADNSFYQMVHSGARGDKTQLRQLLTAPGIMLDSRNRPITVPVKKSYAEGLSTSDYMIASYGVRKGIMDRALQTSLPGALSKDIMASTLDNIITSADCGVKKGYTVSPQHRDALERYLAKDQHGFTRNTLVTPQVAGAMHKKGAHQIEVRSPLACLAVKGTCAHCYGLDEFGQPPAIGDNVGVRTGQALSEPLAQSVMRTFHTGGVAGKGTSTAQGFDRIQQLFRMPKYVAGEATLALHDGKVEKIKSTAAGGHEVMVAGVGHAVRPGIALKIKVGDVVGKGDMLSEGVIRPQDLKTLKGMGAAQSYMADELQKAYHDQNIPMQRRVFETVIRSFGNLTRVVSAPKHGDFTQGEVIPWTVAQHYNETRATKLPVADTVGYSLRHATGNLPVHHEVTNKDIDHLRAAGYNQIEVIKDPLRHAPILKNIERLPEEKENWMAQLGYRYIKKSLTEGAAQAWKTNVEGEHPIPAFAYGASFGKKKEHY